jgi:cation-transporting P-type ATPase E
MAGVTVGAGETGGIPSGGLSSAEVAQRVAAGQVNRVEQPTSRSTLDIVRANTLTPFNALIGALFAVVLLAGDWRDSLFGFVIVINTGIGIVQEMRAKRTLDRLAVLGETRPSVRRDGVVQEIPADEVVQDDLLVVTSGDEIVVDGTVASANGLEVDESLLTGEADPVSKHPGEELLSGSFVVEGEGTYVASKVGSAGYAASLSAEAKRFTLAHSELRDGINRILKVMTVLAVPVGLLLVWSQWRTVDGTPGESVTDAVGGAVAGLVTMIPEGLVLLTSIAFAVGAMRLARRNVLVQELDAVEGLARIDVLCIDKTGTLTEPGMVLRELVPLSTAPLPSDQLGQVVAAFAANDPAPNASLAAIAAAFADAPSWPVSASVPFSSARKWSGVAFDGHGAWVLGAPDLLLSHDDPAARTAGEYADRGLRVLLFAATSADLTDAGTVGQLTPAALLTIEQRVKEDAAETLEYFARQGVDVKVISGDGTSTVAAVATQVGLRADAAIDARELSDDPVQLAGQVEQGQLFARVTPAQKRSMVEALVTAGHDVAMTGDGVNDVLALKSADVGIAMASGSDATRAVAQLVLVDNRFENLPGVVAEGRRVVNNIERVGALFLTKTVYATALSVLSAAFGLAFPFLPRHLTVVTAFTIGIPSFFLALAPNDHRVESGLVRRILRFAVPAGLVASTAAFLAYETALVDASVTRVQAQTAAAIVLFGVGEYAVVLVSRPLRAWKVVLVAAMIGGFAAVLLIAPLRDFFAFSIPPTTELIEVAATIALGCVVLSVLVRVVGWRPHRDQPIASDPQAQRGKVAA